MLIGSIAERVGPVDFFTDGSATSQAIEEKLKELEIGYTAHYREPGGNPDDQNSTCYPEIRVNGEVINCDEV